MPTRCVGAAYRSAQYIAQYINGFLYSLSSSAFFFFFIIPAELSSTCYTTTEAPVIAHHAKLGGLRLVPKGPAIQGGAPPIKGKKGRGVNWFTYRVAFV